MFKESSPLGWSYPAGAYNDPRAPWNEPDEYCEDCGHIVDDCECIPCDTCKEIGLELRHGLCDDCSDWGDDG